MSLIDFPFIKRKEEAKEPDEAKPVSPKIDEQDSLKLKLCRIIIERYRDTIEEHESKTISELRLLVKPDDPVAQKVKHSIAENFHPYSYEECFLQASKMAFAHVSAFQVVSSPVTFWLSFSEMRSIMAGDEIDQSLLLCSILRSLGSGDSKVFVTDSKNSYVIFQYESKAYLASHSEPALGEFETIAAAMSAMKGRPLYSFNDRDFEDYQE